ncbi:MAG: DUF393 domain-containing protein [Verrucomicrobiota bacterium]|nr:DUF393 domain-containing protein [Verrucomicrobiota bacterium]
MKTLYVLYDQRCVLCRRMRLWLGRQSSFVRLAFIPLQSAEVGCRFPGIERLHPEEKLLVVNDAGEVWGGENAWIMVLWALREYREWAQRLAHPTLRPLARRACTIISENRHRLSRWLWREPVEVVKRELEAIPAEAYENQRCSR